MTSIREHDDSVVRIFTCVCGSHKQTQRPQTLVYFTLNAFWFEFSGSFNKAEVQSLRRRRTDVADVGESTLDVGEQTVGETTRRRNDPIPYHHIERRTTDHGS